MKAVERFCLLSLFLSSLFFFSSCRNEDTKAHAAQKMFGINATAPVHFVVPVGFRGRVSITRDNENGIVPPILNGKIDINVPENGRVTLKDWSCFYSDHEESASYADGTMIPNPDLVPAGIIFPDNEIGFWTLGVDHAAGAGG